MPPTGLRAVFTCSSSSGGGSSDTRISSMHYWHSVLQPLHPFQFHTFSVFVIHTQNHLPGRPVRRCILRGVTSCRQFICNQCDFCTATGWSDCCQGGAIVSSRQPGRVRLALTAKSHWLAYEPVALQRGPETVLQIFSFFCTREWQTAGA
jgi:hypothetical protein